MKTVIFGDIHGRTIWKDILEKENPDFVIFLGDYVSTHQLITEKQQIDNLEEILKYKESHKGTVRLLRGNHDLEALGYDECYPATGKVVKDYMDLNRERFANLTQWIYVPGIEANDDPTVIYSHAGITEQWLEKKAWKKAKMNSFQDIDQINDIPIDDWIFGFSRDDYFDTYGTGMTQPCTWVRPQTLYKYGIEAIHVVGHTTVHHISEPSSENKTQIWFCDCLDNGEYLVNIDGKFEPRKYERA